MCTAPAAHMAGPLAGGRVGGDTDRKKIACLAKHESNRSPLHGGVAAVLGLALEA